MNLIRPSYEIIEQSNDLDCICKHIELAGRVCYKSEDKITENSASEFFRRMVNSGHRSVLEHGTVYLAIKDYKDTDELRYKHNLYSRAVCYYPNVLYVTTNMRVIIENDWAEDLKWICEPTKHHEKRVTVKFTCDRGVSHELVRHRVFSFSQESQRYCNYTKDKFNNEITFIIPSWIDIPEGSYTYWDGDWCDTLNTKINYPSDNSDIDHFLHSISTAEVYYQTLINKGWKPQQARAALPNATKTEVVMTGFISDWKHFFSLRDSLKAHPDMYALAHPLHEEFKKRYDENI